MTDANLTSDIIDADYQQPEIISDTISALTGSDDLFYTPLIGPLTLSDIIGITVVILVVIALLIIIRPLIRKTLTGRLGSAYVDALITFISWVIVLIAFPVICGYLHFDLTGLLVAGGVLGIIAGFASQSTLSNLVAGIILIFEHPISLGQEINVGTGAGYVEKIGFISTKLRTYEGVYLRVPNNTLFNSNIVNYSADIAYGFSLKMIIPNMGDHITPSGTEKAIQMITNILNEEPMVLKNMMAPVLISEITFDGVELSTMVWVPAFAWQTVKPQLIARIYNSFENSGIYVSEITDDNTSENSESDWKMARLMHLAHCRNLRKTISDSRESQKQDEKFS